MLTLANNHRAANQHETPPVTLHERESQMDDPRHREGFGERMHSDHGSIFQEEAISEKF